VFETYYDIVDAACKAWNKLIDQPNTITSIGMRDWAHVIVFALKVGPLFG